MKKSLALFPLLLLAACAAPRTAPAPAPQPAPPPGVPLPPPPPAGEPQDFTGLDAARLRALVGAPVFSRKDGASEMWRYDVGSCRVFFFLTGTPAKVQHVESLPQGAGSAADPACLSALRGRKS